MSKSSQEKDVKQWEEALCPICMEPPHNAVLLICSSHDKGCRPFVCDTSCRLLNCLDKLCISAGGEPSPLIYHPQEFVPNPRLLCPLCRGSICSWEVIESARETMDAMSRSCLFETCDFVGTYNHLIKHVSSIHPLSIPTANDLVISEHSRRRSRNIRAIEDRISMLEPSQQLEAYTAMTESLKRLLERENAVIMEQRRLQAFFSRRILEKEEQLQNMNKHGANASEEC